MNEAIELKIQELVSLHGYDADVLRDFARFALSQPKKCRSRKTKKKSLSIAELKSAVMEAFGCKDYKSLKKNEAFKLAISGRNLDFRKKDTWLTLYREWVGVPEDEQNQEGPTCINGIDVLQHFRPWHVFKLDPKTATGEDIKSAFRNLAKKYHPDHGGDRRVFERLQKMRDSILAFR